MIVLNEKVYNSGSSLCGIRHILLKWNPWNPLFSGSNELLYQTTSPVVNRNGQKHKT